MAYNKNGQDKYPLGSAIGKGGGVVPGSTGSSDRESQPEGAEFMSQDQKVQPNPAFNILDGGNDRLDPRKNENFGKSSYAYNKPTL